MADLSSGLCQGKAHDSGGTGRQQKFSASVQAVPGCCDVVQEQHAFVSDGRRIAHHYRTQMDINVAASAVRQFVDGGVSV